MNGLKNKVAPPRHRYVNIVIEKREKDNKRPKRIELPGNGKIKAVGSTVQDSFFMFAFCYI